MATPLHDVPFFHSGGGVLLLYIGAMVLFGCLTLLLRKFFIIFTTSFGGSMMFFLGTVTRNIIHRSTITAHMLFHPFFFKGVDYFVRSDFAIAVEYALTEFKDAILRSIHHHDVHLKFDRRFSRDSVSKEIYFFVGLIQQSNSAVCTAYILLGSWLLLSIIGCVVQYATGDRDSPVCCEMILSPEESFNTCVSRSGPAQDYNCAPH